jgi:4-hydroxy-3-methylbut-2-enyl diphosphate reductase IspH
MEIVLANPRGFCAGVDRAIAIVNRALECLIHQFMYAMKWYTINLS